MPAKFTHTDRLSFRTLVSDKLGEITNVFRTETELNQIIDESLLTFGAAAQAWKEDIRIDIDNTQQFYDITTDAAINQVLIAFSSTYQFILNRLNSILFEEISLANPTSDITSLDEILRFCVNRVNLYQLKTGLIISKANYVMPAPPTNIKKISDEAIEIVRAAFKDIADTNKFYVLMKEDEASLAFNSDQVFNTTAKIPTFYTSVLGTLNEIYLYPQPANLGELEILSVNGISATTTITPASIIPIPNNLVPYILFGVLADVFAKDGLGNDPNRAAYCEERWEEGIIIGNNYTSILVAYLNGKPIQLDSIVDIDTNYFGWQNIIGKPNLIGLAGYNLLAPNKIPDQPYSLLLRLITNAYLPVNDSDSIDVKPEYIEPLSNYCVHLAMIKDGVQAIKTTDQLRQTFLKIAIGNNIRMMKRGQSVEEIFKKTKRQEEAEPTREEQAA